MPRPLTVTAEIRSTKIDPRGYGWIGVED